MARPALLVIYKLMLLLVVQLRPATTEASTVNTEAPSTVTTEAPSIDNTPAPSTTTTPAPSTTTTPAPSTTTTPAPSTINTPAPSTVTTEQSNLRDCFHCLIEGRSQGRRTHQRMRATTEASTVNTDAPDLRDCFPCFPLVEGGSEGRRGHQRTPDNGEASPDNTDAPSTINTDATPMNNTNTSNKSRHRLRSNCSGELVRIISADTGVDAKLPSWRFMTNLLFVNEGNNTVRIQRSGNKRRGKKQLALCFKNRGRLAVKIQSRYTRRNRKCKFEEILGGDNKYKFRSVFNSSWYVGFNRDGDPLNGTVIQENLMGNCYEFFKTNITI